MSDRVATAIVEVAVDPPTAFEVFTEEIAALVASATVGFEPGVGGRVLTLAHEPEIPPIEVGRVSCGRPVPRLAFTYRDDAEVEVRFEASETGTRVVLEHHEDFDRQDLRDRPFRGLGRVARSVRRPGDRERVLLGRLAEFVTAIAEHDVEFFRENMTDDAMCVFPGSDGVYDREQTATGMAGPSSVREVSGRGSTCHRRGADGGSADGARCHPADRRRDPAIVGRQQHVRELRRGLEAGVRAVDARVARERHACR